MICHRHSSSFYDDSLDGEYWQKMTSVIDKSKERVWNALEEGFEKYLSVLTDRAALIQETETLELQVLQPFFILIYFK